MKNLPIYHWNNRNILVVEDDESSTLLLCEILKDTGAKVKYTTDGNEAVEYVKENRDIDLILMDIHLPEKDGFTATREIKVIASQVVVIAQTAFAFSVDYYEARKAGCDAFFTKPLNPYLLLDKMNSYLA